MANSAHNSNITKRYKHKLKVCAKKIFTHFLAFTFIIYSTPAPYAYANPVGGEVSAGSASIVESGNNLTVNQTSDKAVIDWRGFNIEAGETTHFNQPSTSSMTVNRVNSLDPSHIFGTLSANGNIMLLNQNGVLFGANSRVDVGGIVASTANISNADFMAGRMNFTAGNNHDATIENLGQITAAEAGLVGLVAPNVKNSGVISARLGRVHLASGDSFALDMYGDGLMSIGISDDVKSQVVENAGIINAAGGTIKMTAAAGRQMVNSLIKVDGMLNAPAVGQKNGKIYIFAEGSNAVEGNVAADKGVKGGNSTVKISGTLAASGKGAGETGGEVAVLGDLILLDSNSKIDASGAIGGGVVNVGGEYQGKGNTAAARAVVIRDGAEINADAISAGNGGRAIIWSDKYTNVAGKISVKGGANNGNGGFIETSSHGVLNVDNATIIATAPYGTGGTWLLDPRDVTISNSANSGDLTSNSGNPDIFTPHSDTTNISVATILTQLNNGVSVTITTGSDGSQNGDITVADDIQKTAGGAATLTLNAAGSITLYKNDIYGDQSNLYISSTSNALNVMLNANYTDAGTGGIYNNATIDTNGGYFKAVGGSSGSGAAPEGFFNYAVYGIISTGAGDITIIGSNSSSYGVRNSSNITTTSGNINITGTNNTVGGSGNHGVYNDSGGGGGSIGSSSGTITIIGTGGAGTVVGAGNYGVFNYGTITNGSGNINITGTGGNGTKNQNYGITTSGSGAISTSNGGSIIITGYGAGRSGLADTAASNSTTANYGVYLQASTIRTTSGGDITINGYGGNGTSGNSGVYIYSSNTISSTGSTFTINGYGGYIGGGYGVYMALVSLTTINANLYINGHGADVAGTNYGVYILGNSGANANISSTGSGNIYITASEYAGATNHANNAETIYLGNYSSITTSAASSGAISLTAGNNGVINVVGAQTISTHAGAITLNGAITLGNTLTLNTTTSSATGANISIGGTVNGAYALTVNSGTSGTATLGGALGGTTGLGAIAVTAGGGINLNSGSIKTTANASNTLTLTGAVILGSNLAIDTTNGSTSTSSATAGAISFTSTINGGYTLTTQSGTGLTTFGGNIGTGTALNAISVSGNGGTSLSGNITTNNANATFNNAVTLGANSTISLGSGTLTYTTIAGAGTYSLAATAGSFSGTSLGTAASRLTTLTLTSSNNLTVPTIYTTGDVTVTSGGNITVASSFLKSSTVNDSTIAMYSSAAGTLTLNATGNITTNNVSITSTSNVLNIMLNANYTDSGTGSISNSADITTNGGYFKAVGGSSGTGAILGGFYNDGYIYAEAGNITINAQTSNGAGGNLIGVHNTGTINTTSGNINITGTSRATGGASNYGVYNSVLSGGGNISSSSGTITIIATGGAGTTTNSGNYGFVNSGTISNGSGDVNITGTGGNGTNNQNYGVYSSGGTITTSNGGAINITGYGAGRSSLADATTSNSTSSNYGVYLVNSTITTTSGGNITINGYGGNASGGFGTGVYISNGSTNISSTGTSLTINGYGGNGGSSNSGVLIYGLRSTSLTIINANLYINGYGGDSSGTNNYGVYTLGTSGTFNSNIISTGTGNITITTGEQAGATNHANNAADMYLGDYSSITTSAASSGNISLTAGTYGVINVASAQAKTISTHGGTISLSGAVTLGNTLTLDSTTSSATGANITVGGTVNGAQNLTITAGTAGLATFSGVVGGNTGLGDASITAGGGITFNQSFKASTILANTTSGSGNITLNNATILTETAASGNSLTLATVGLFVNNSTANSGAGAGSGALATTGTSRFLVYSADLRNDTYGSLAHPTIRYNKTYAGYAPASVTETGNVFLYTLAPTLTITPDAISVGYGNAASLTGYSYSVSGYLLTDSGGLSGSLTGTSTYSAGSNVGGGAGTGGTYNINYSSGSLLSEMGYQFTYANNANAITVTQRAITVAATAGQTKAYGAGDPTLTYSLTSGSLSSVGASKDLTGSLARAAGENAGTYAINQGTLANSNYSITFTGGQTFAITQSIIALTIAADAKSKIYGAVDPTLTYSLTSGSLNGGDSFTGALSRTAGESVGSYAINQGTLTAGVNYLITYNGSFLTITAAEIAATVANTPDLTNIINAISNIDKKDNMPSNYLADSSKSISITYAPSMNSFKNGTFITHTVLSQNVVFIPNPYEPTKKIYDTIKPTEYDFVGLIQPYTISNEIYVPFLPSVNPYKSPSLLRPSSSERIRNSRQ